MSKQRIRDLTAAFMGDNRPEMVSHPVVVDSALLCIHAVTEPELKHIEDVFNSPKRERAKNSSSTILSSSTNLTQVKKRIKKRARRVDDDDVGYDDGSMKRINRSGVIIPVTVVQKHKRARNSSSTILSSNTIMS